MLLSLLAKKRPSVLMANTRRPLMLSTPMIVCTHSYSTALPALREASTLEATCARMSLIWSLAVESPRPKWRNSRRILTCRKGLHTPLISKPEEEPPPCTNRRSILHSAGILERSLGTWEGSVSTICSIRVTSASSTAPSGTEGRSTITPMNSSSSSGTFLIILVMHKSAFFRSYGQPFNSLRFTSGVRSRAISAEQMLPRAAKASPTM
mmetsp:Transcript_434/g.1116  ORF Transcript_434/g.1116 Transcript_434/m.1116 type:complete len:209 (-) Transcript_434:463-1089(-)